MRRTKNKLRRNEVCSYLLTICFFIVCHQALRRLAVQAEDIGAANLGDLEGFARDMALEVHILRQVCDTTTALFIT